MGDFLVLLFLLGDFFAEDLLDVDSSAMGVPSPDLARRHQSLDQLVLPGGRLFLVDLAAAAQLLDVLQLLRILTGS